MSVSPGMDGVMKFSKDTYSCSPKDVNVFGDPMIFPLHHHEVGICNGECKLLTNIG